MKSIGQVAKIWWDRDRIIANKFNQMLWLLFRYQKNNILPLFQLPYRVCNTCFLLAHAYSNVVNLILAITDTVPHAYILSYANKIRIIFICACIHRSNRKRISYRCRTQFCSLTLSHNNNQFSLWYRASFHDNVLSA